MPVVQPSVPVTPMQLRNIMSSINGAARLNKRAIDQVDKLLGRIDDDFEEDEDDPTQKRFPPRRTPVTSTRTLLATSAAFADTLGSEDAGDGPVALVEQAKRNVEKLTQHRSNLMIEQKKTDDLIRQWMHIAHALDDEEEIDD